MISFENKSSHTIDISKIEKIAENLSDKEIELLVVESDEMRDLNRKFRGIDATTDVISFPFEDVPNAPLGVIVINSQKAKEEAEKLGHSADEEIALLFIHGLLHLLGYDHECDEGQMRERERELIERFNLPKSLIVRSESDS